MTKKKAPRIRIPRPKLAKLRKVPKLDNLALQLEQLIEDIKHSELTRDHKYLESQVLATVRQRVQVLEEKERADIEDLRDKGRRVVVLEGQVHRLNVAFIRFQTMTFWHRVKWVLHGWPSEYKLRVEPELPAFDPLDTLNNPPPQKPRPS